MNWKRTKISYAFWVLLLAVTGICTYEVVNLISSQWGIGGYIPYAILAGVLLAGGLFSVLLFKFREKFFPVYEGKMFLWNILEGVLLLCIVSAGIYLRIRALPEASNGSLANLYELTMMKYHTPLMTTGHGGEDLYLQILHGICFMLGNTDYFQIRFQLVLSVIAGLIWLWGVRNLAGPVPAITFSAFYFLDPFMVSKAVCLSAETLITLFYGIGLVCMASFLKKHSSLWFGYLLAGICIGIIGYMDIFGWTLLIFAFSIYHFEREKPEGKVHSKGAALGFLLAGCLIGFAIGLGIGCATLQLGIAEVLGQYGSLFSGWITVFSLQASLLWDLESSFAAPMQSIGFLVVTGAALLTVSGFFRKDGKERISPWTGILVLSLLMKAVSVSPLLTYSDNDWTGSPAVAWLETPFDGCILVLLCFAVLAGIGLTNVFMPSVSVAETAEEISKAEKKEPFSIQKLILAFKRRKEERKAALNYAIDHPETMENKNPITKFFFQRAKQKAEAQREIDKVMYALNSLSGDHVVIEDFTRDPHPEEHRAHDKESGLFHHRKHEELKSETEEHLQPEKPVEAKADVQEQAEKPVETKAEAQEKSENAETKSVDGKAEEVELPAETKPAVAKTETQEQTEKIVGSKTEIHEQPAKPAELEPEVQTHPEKPEETKGVNARSEVLEDSEKAADVNAKAQEQHEEPVVVKPVETYSEAREQSEKPTVEKPEIQEQSDRTVETKQEANEKAERAAETEAVEMRAEAQEQPESAAPAKPEESVQPKLPEQPAVSRTENTNGGSEESTKSGKKTDRKKATIKKEKKGLFGSKKKKDKEGSAVAVQDENAVEEKQDSAAAESDKPKMLDNPLPLPKKHVTSVMDYDYEVSDDDDYDIKD